MRPAARCAELTGYPHHTRRIGGRAAEQRRLFDHDDVEPLQVRRQRRGKIRPDPATSTSQLTPSALAVGLAF